ncbi:MAG: HD domain-containing phosphohydrolase, partial [SAR324 cluster bacterium]|nr:HD domain-containing phosphohydrolase [SAR324 cluster bacterium]
HELDEQLKFIIRCNEPTVLAQGGFEKLQEIEQLRFAHPSGGEVPYLNAGELHSLLVPKGSLNEQDRVEIESHVTHTYNFLRIIPWSANLIQVPEIAYAHHEKLNGSGYPRKLNGEEIPLQAKMMTISDIYDALTAWDRPYKKAMPAERAFNILGFEAKDGHIDTDLLEIFIDAKLYMLVSRPRTG